MFIVTALFVIFIQYVGSAPQDIAFAGSNSGSELKTSNGQVPGYQRGHAGRAPRSAQHEYIIYLKEHPNYSTTINLRNVVHFNCVWRPGSNCSVVLTPPENHGIIVIVQELNIRLNVRPNLGEICNSLPASPGPFAPSPSQYNVPCQCRDYLLVSGSRKHTSAKLCGRINRKQNGAAPAPFFIGESQYLFDVNDTVRLTLFHDGDSPHDGLYNDKWDLDADIGGIITVTSYFECSNLTSWQRLGYRNCASSASGAQCISSTLFCDGNTNCKYDETSQNDGHDEVNCSGSKHKDEDPPSSFPLLPVNTSKSPTQFTTTTPITLYYRTTTPSSADGGIPVYTYNDIRRSKSKPYPEGSNYLSITFVFIVFSTVVLLTLCFGCLKLPSVHSRNYDTNEPLDNARNASTLHHAHSNSSIDTIDRVVAVTAPPPEYPEVSGLPSYDSLFKEEASMPRSNNGDNNNANYNDDNTNDKGVR